MYLCGYMYRWREYRYIRLLDIHETVWTVKGKQVWPLYWHSSRLYGWNSLRTATDPKNFIKIMYRVETIIPNNGILCLLVNKTINCTLIDILKPFRPNFDAWKTYYNLPKVIYLNQSLVTIWKIDKSKKSFFFKDRAGDVAKIL